MIRKEMPNNFVYGKGKTNKFWRSIIRKRAFIEQRNTLTCLWETIKIRVEELIVVASGKEQDTKTKRAENSARFLFYNNFILSSEISTILSLYSPPSAFLKFFLLI